MEGQVESRGTGVPLPARASAKLIVDPSAFMPFRTQDMEPPLRDHLLLIGFALRFDFFVDGLFPVLGKVLVLIQDSFEQKIRVDTKDDIRAPPRHVACDRHGALLPSLCDDLGFLLMVLGVEHVVFDRLPCEVTL